MLIVKVHLALFAACSLRVCFHSKLLFSCGSFGANVIKAKRQVLKQVTKRLRDQQRNPECSSGLYGVLKLLRTAFHIAFSKCY